MLKKVLITAAAALLLCGWATQGYTSDAGPEEITFQSSTSSKPKPAVFPHKAHQATLECGECHHGMADGKQVPYAEGMEIGKCESCHNAEKLAGKMKDKDKLDTLKGAGHGNCLACHKEVAGKDKAKAALKKCSTCHPKK